MELEYIVFLFWQHMHIGVMVIISWRLDAYFCKIHGFDIFDFGDLKGVRVAVVSEVGQPSKFKTVCSLFDVLWADAEAMGVFKNIYKFPVFFF